MGIGMPRIICGFGMLLGACLVALAAHAIDCDALRRPSFGTRSRRARAHHQDYEQILKRQPLSARA
jgi:hypothetical protein